MTEEEFVYFLFLENKKETVCVLRLDNIVCISHICQIEPIDRITWSCTSLEESLVSIKSLVCIFNNLLVTNLCGFHKGKTKFESSACDGQLSC